VETTMLQALLSALSNCITNPSSGERDHPEAKWLALCGHNLIGSKDQVKSFPHLALQVLNLPLDCKKQKIIASLD
jgi:hypothetical protein